MTRVPLNWPKRLFGPSNRRGHGWLRSVRTMIKNSRRSATRPTPATKTPPKESKPSTPEKRESEIQSVDFAIAEATKRVQQARAAETQAQARNVAKEILKRADRLVALAQTVDDANRVRVAGLRAIADELTEMRSLAHGISVFVPSHDQLTALGSRAEHTAGMQTPFAREIAEHLPPNHRRDHMSYVAGWRDTIAKSAAALVGEDKPKQQAEEAA
jgi:hypothetical protein